jgi:hypothetical protein
LPLPDPGANFLAGGNPNRRAWIGVQRIDAKQKGGIVKKLCVLTAALLGIGGLVLTISPTAGATAKTKVPTITSVVPDHGSVNGGTTVTINGKNIVSATAVSFGGTPAESFTPKSNSALTAVSPPGTGTVDITVKTSVGTSSVVPADQFTYVTTPVIQNVSPGRGATTGDNRVTISGSDFTNATAVDFGSTPAASFTVDSDQAITAYSPAGSAGTVNVSVTGPDGTSPSDTAADYTFAVVVPKVTSVAPDTGSASGDTQVVITGSRFGKSGANKVLAVDFGSVAATSFTVSNGSTIDAMSPAGSGTVDVTVTTGRGTSSINEPADEFTYQPSD